MRPSLTRRQFLAASAATAAAMHTTFAADSPAPANPPVLIRIDCSKPIGPLKPVWRYFGHDEPNYTYMKDGQKLLSQLAAINPNHTINVRTHNLLCTGDGTPAYKWGSTNAYTEDAAGNAVYDWTITDRIFDTYMQRKIKPYVQIGFTPKALSIHPEPYQHTWRPGRNYNEVYTGWAYPPKDYAKWGELVFQWAKHCGEKYGQAEAESWFWEVWNEPNIGYWKGTPDEFNKLYDYAADAVRRALPKARIGGPEVAGGNPRWFENFIEHCLRGTNHATGKVGSPLDLVSFHAKGAPKFENGHVRMGISNHLSVVDRHFAAIAKYPELRNTPVVIGESDPDGCAACSAQFSPQNGYRNSTLFASYTVATFARIHELAEKHKINLEGILTWSFEFEDQPYFAGFRVLATNGLALPVLNAFRMLGQVNGQRLPVESSADSGVEKMIKSGVRDQPDVYALAGLEDRALSILVWNYHDDDLSALPADVTLTITGLPAAAAKNTLHHYRIDDEHSNSYTAWKKMGSPQNPTAEQYATLERASMLTQLNAPAPLAIDAANAAIRLLVPRQGVSLFRLIW